ncbi:MAG: macro domain-containing protein [Eubacterium sp.]|nr:macro domain-containing protein [Eubacterium sp.]
MIKSIVKDVFFLSQKSEPSTNKAAGYDELLKYRQERIGYVAEGEVFITPGFNLSSKYIIHAVSPLYDGEL